MLMQDLEQMKRRFSAFLDENSVNDGAISGSDAVRGCPHALGGLNSVAVQRS